MARTIDADKAIEVAQIKYNDWNLAMAAADGRREINLCFKKQELFKAVKAVLDCVPTLTPPNEPLTLDSRLTPKMVTCPKVWQGVRDTRFYCPGCKKAVKKGEAYCHKCGQALVFPVQRYDKENNRIWLDFSNRRPPEGEA